ncbi:MAG: YCF48-related protein [candidate division WOR-3 bacterium]
MKRLLVIVSVCFSLLLALWTPVGPGGGNVYSGDISNTSPAVIYFAPYNSSTRLVKSTDEGITWVQTAGVLSGYVSDLLVHPANPNIVYACLGSSIYRTTDGGASWTRLNTPGSNYFREMAFNPRNPNVIYAAGYYYGASPYKQVLVRSDDGGNTWSAFYFDTTTANAYGYSLAIDPVDTATVYVGGYRASGLTTLHRSSDRGQTWEELPFGISGYYPYTIYISPANPNLIFVAPYTSGIYRSTDRGQTWTRTASVSAVYRLTGASGNPAVLYASTSGSVYRIQDTGRTWTVINRGLTGTPNFCLMTSPNSTPTVYVGTKTGLFRSTNYGDTWENLIEELYLSQVKVVALAEDPATVYVECLNDGVYKSTDNGISWRRCPDFLSCGNIISIAVDPRDPLRVWVLEGSG